MVRAGTYGYRVNLLWIAYLIVGAVVAADRHYLEAVNNIEQVVEALSPSSCGRWFCSTSACGSDAGQRP
jgi:hypothetical protein